jgi:activating signal cointegrator 1
MIKAITVIQPWAQAIALGFKKYETRSWSTDYRGPLLIHAAARWTKEEVRFQFELVHHLRCEFGADDPRVLEFEQNPVRGAVVAVAELVACHPITSVCFAFTRMEDFLGDFTPGRFAWELANVTRLKTPYRCRGYQGLWWPDFAIEDLDLDGKGAARASKHP